MGNDLNARNPNGVMVSVLVSHVKVGVSEPAGGALVTPSCRYGYLAPSAAGHVKIDRHGVQYITV